MGSHSGHSELDIKYPIIRNVKKSGKKYIDVL